VGKWLGSAAGGCVAGLPGAWIGGSLGEDLGRTLGVRVAEATYGPLCAALVIVLGAFAKLRLVLPVLARRAWRDALACLLQWVLGILGSKGGAWLTVALAPAWAKGDAETLGAFVGALVARDLLGFFHR
jgi:hypothetical protein